MYTYIYTHIYIYTCTQLTGLKCATQLVEALLLPLRTNAPPARLPLSVEPRGAGYACIRCLKVCLIVAYKKCIHIYIHIYIYISKQQFAVRKDMLLTGDIFLIFLLLLTSGRRFQTLRKTSATAGRRKNDSFLSSSRSLCTTRCIP